MPEPKPYFFVSYSHQDKEIVYRIIDDLARHGIQTWSDRNLHAGDNWVDASASALRAASGLIIFLSSASINSEWVMSELRAATANEDVPIIPVLIERVYELPEQIHRIYYIDLPESGYENAIERLVSSLKQWEEKEIASSQLDVRKIAEDFVLEAKTLNREEPPESAPTSIFIVHGHDEDFLEDIKQFLSASNITPIVLSEEENRHESLFQKFWKHSAGVRFAIVLLSSDDLGCALREFNEVFLGNQAQDHALKYRARQNVILELGFFYGRLGTDRVFVLMKSPPTYYPMFERPSDIDGIVFDEYDTGGNWRKTLTKTLRGAGFAI